MLWNVLNGACQCVYDRRNHSNNPVDTGRSVSFRFMLQWRNYELKIKIQEELNSLCGKAGIGHRGTKRPENRDYKSKV